MRVPSARLSVIVLSLGAALVAQLIVSCHTWPSAYVPHATLEGSEEDGFHDDYLRGFSPDGRTVFAMSFNRYTDTGGDHHAPIGLTAWEVASGRVRYTITGAYGCLAVSRDSSLLSLAERTKDGDSVAKVYDAATGRERLNLGEVRSFSQTEFTVEGDLLVQVTSVEAIPVERRPDDFYYDCNQTFGTFGLPHFQPEIHVWDMNSGTRIATHPLDGQVTKFEISSDALLVVAVRENGTVALFDSMTGIQKGVLPRQFTDDEMKVLRISPDGRILATGSILWDVSTLKEAIQLPPFANPIADVSFSPDSSKVLIRDYGSVYVYDCATGRSLGIFPCHFPNFWMWTPEKLPSIESTQMTPSGRACSWCNGSGTKLVVYVSEIVLSQDNMPDVRSYLQVWDVPDHKEGPRVEGVGPFVSPDGNLVAAWGETAVVLWDLPPRTDRTVFVALSVTIWSVWLLSMSCLLAWRRRSLPATGPSQNTGNSSAAQQ